MRIELQNGAPLWAFLVSLYELRIVRNYERSFRKITVSKQ